MMFRTAGTLLVLIACGVLSSGMRTQSTPLQIFVSDLLSDICVFNAPPPALLHPNQAVCFTFMSLFCTTKSAVAGETATVLAFNLPKPSRDLSFHILAHLCFNLTFSNERSALCI